MDSLELKVPALDLPSHLSQVVQENDSSETAVVVLSGLHMSLPGYADGRQAQKPGFSAT